MWHCLSIIFRSKIQWSRRIIAAAGNRHRGCVIINNKRVRHDTIDMLKFHWTWLRCGSPCIGGKCPLIRIDFEHVNVATYDNSNTGKKKQQKTIVKGHALAADGDRQHGHVYDMTRLTLQPRLMKFQHVDCVTH